MSTVIYLPCSKFVKSLLQVSEIHSLYLQPDNHLSVLNHSYLPCIPEESYYSFSKINDCHGVELSF